MVSLRHKTWKTFPLWEHQQRAVQTISDYIEAESDGSALIRMPTGTGKTGVIATAARCLPNIQNVLILTPWAALRKQLERDLNNRFWSRIGVDPEPWPANFQLVFPSTVRRSVDESKGKTIFIGTIAALQATLAGRESDFHALRKQIDLVLVDEGHREPAPKWGHAVRGLGKPTVLLTATPYRNDHKIFNVDPMHIYPYSHRRAVEERFIREVQFHETNFKMSAESFVKELLDFYNGKFWRSRPSAVKNHRVIVRCQTDAEVNEVAAVLKERGESVVAIHERFTDEEEGYIQDVPETDKEDATFWVHQNKLIEGIDDPRFSLVAIYGPFTNARSLVQQVGRVLRNPSRVPDQLAWVFSNVAHGQKPFWDGYRAYEEDFERNPERREVRQHFFTIVKQQAEFEYFDGAYRKRFDFEAPDLHLRFKYPLAANVFRLHARYDMKEFYAALAEEWHEADLEIIRTEHPDKNTLVEVYVSFGNSPLLKDEAFIGYKIGITVVHRDGNFMYFWDSEGNSCEYLVRNVEPVSPIRLQRLFAGKQSRLSQLSLMNMDLGRRSIRRRTVHAHSLSETAPGLADHFHFCSTAAGHVGSSADELQRRYVGFTRGRVSDFSTPSVDLETYLAWIHQISKELSDSNNAEVDLFERFADFVPPPEDPEAQNILFDLEDAFELYRTKALDPDKNTTKLDTDDLCLAVGTDDPGCVRWNLNGKFYDVKVSYDTDRKRYLLECPKLERAYVRIEGKGQNLVSYLNREQSFRIVPATSNVIYSHGRFYAPRLRLGGVQKKNKLDLFQILEETDKLGELHQEKFPALKNGTGWSAGTVFHLIDSLGRGTEMHKLMRDFDILICDDAGKNEIADFIATDSATRRVVLIHAKAARETRLLSASAFADVCNQAVKNLDILTPFSAIEPANLRSWGTKWRTSWNEVPQVVNRRIRKGPKSPSEAWQRIQSLIRDPAANREVWIVVGSTFSREEFRDAANRTKQPAEVIQILYSLQSTWGSVASIGARLRVFCSP
jgi:superfamily II DNA or RNA helicase